MTAIFLNKKSLCDEIDASRNDVAIMIVYVTIIPSIIILVVICDDFPH